MRSTRCPACARRANSCSIILPTYTRLCIPDAESRQRLLEGVSCEALTLGPHIISAQLAQRIGYKFGGNSLAPRHVEVRIVQRLGDSSREHGRFSNCLLIQEAA